MQKLIFKRCGSLVAALLFCGLAKAQIQFEPDRTIKESRFGIIKNTILTIDDDAKAIVMRPLKNPNLEKNAVKLFTLVATDYMTTKLFQDHIEPLDVHIQSIFVISGNFRSNVPFFGQLLVVSTAMYTLV